MGFEVRGCDTRISPCFRALKLRLRLIHRMTLWARAASSAMLITLAGQPPYPEASEAMLPYLGVGPFGERCPLTVDRLRLIGCHAGAPGNHLWAITIARLVALGFRLVPG